MTAFPSKMRAATCVPASPGTTSIGAAPRRAVIVGAGGRMGSLFLRRARAAGFPAEGIDLPFSDAALAAVCDGADLILFCVPASVLDGVLRAFVPHLPPTATVADITSVKEWPMTLMRRHWRGPVVGTHPLFGPGVRPGDPHPVAVVPDPDAGDAHVRLVTAFFEAVGCHPFLTTAGEHDRAMARIQNLNFITNLVYFAMLAGDESLTPFLTPSFRRRHDAARKMLTEDAPMFAGLFDANPYSQEAVRQYSNLLHIASAGDIDLLCNRAIRWWPGASLPEHARGERRGDRVAGDLEGVPARDLCPEAS